MKQLLIYDSVELPPTHTHRELKQEWLTVMWCLKILLGKRNSWPLLHRQGSHPSQTLCLIGLGPKASSNEKFGA